MWSIALAICCWTIAAILLGMALKDVDDSLRKALGKGP